MKWLGRMVALILVTLLLLVCSRAIPGVRTDSVHTPDYGGLIRTYPLHVPPTYDASYPVTLVLSLHGGGSAENQRRVSGFNCLADEQGFVVVYPNGTGRRRNTLSTWSGGTC